MAQQHSAVELACKRAADYLLTRQSACGGFCAYRSDDVDEPNLADTYHAVAVLTRLGVDIPRRDDLLAFVAGFAASGQPLHLYRYIGILSWLVPGYHPDARTLQAVRGLELTPIPEGRLSAWLERTRLVVELRRRFGELPEPVAIRSAIEGLAQNGGFGPGPNLRDTSLAVGVLVHCGRSELLTEIRRYIDRLQCPSFGFTPTLDSRMAALDIVEAGVRTCKALALPVRYPDDARAFVLACQAGQGGFARAPGALPGIEQTYEAIEALTALVP